MAPLSGRTETVMRAQLTSFKQYGAGQYLPYQTFVLNSPTAVTNFTPSSVTSGVFTKDSRYLLQETANTYDAHGRITQLTDPRGKVTTYDYNGGPNNAFLSNVTRLKDGTGTVNLVTDLGYNTDGYLSSISDEGGTVRSFTYDGYGRLHQVKNHGGTVVQAYGYTYSRTSGNGWTFQPASPNAVADTRFLQVTPSEKRVVSTEHLDGLGRPIQTVVENGTADAVAATQYDAMGRPWRAWKPYPWNTTSYEGGFSTNATSFYNSYHSTPSAKPYVETQYTTDALSRPKKVIPEFIGTTATAFVQHAYGVDVTAKHRYTEVTDESGKKTRTYTDAFGNTVKTILGYGSIDATTTFEYDVLGQRIKVTDPRGLITTYTYDTRGLLSAKTSPDAGAVQSKYDQAGNLRYSQDANQAAAGQVYFTTYDFAGRPLLSGQGAATFGSLNPFSSASFDTTKGNWLVVRKYDARPTTGVNDFPWNLFTSQINGITLANVTGRLAAVASKSNGSWQITLFSYDSDGRVVKRYQYTHANGGTTVLTALNTTDTLTLDLQGAITRRGLTVSGRAPGTSGTTTTRVGCSGRRSPPRPPRSR